MKHLKFLLKSALLFSGVLWLTSCDNGDETEIVNPSISVTGTDINQNVYQPGETIDLTVDFTTPQGLSGLNWQFFNEGGAPIAGSQVFNSPDDPNNEVLADYTSADVEGSVDISVPVPLNTEGQTLSLVIEVADKASANGAVFTYTFDVEAGVYEYETVLLGGFQNTTEPSFYNAVDNAEYSAALAATNDEMVDFLYYYANTPMNTIASPDNAAAQITWEEQATGDWPLTVENTTMFKNLGTAYDYESIMTTADLANAYINEETQAGANRITNLEKEQVIAFMLDDDRGTRYGLFKVVDIGGSSETGGSQRSITLNVKIQANANN